MQQYAGIYLLQNHSTCFGCLSHPSSGVHKTVTAASGTGNTVKYKSLNYPSVLYYASSSDFCTLYYDLYTLLHNK
jgi:hypothetical protein